MKLETICIMCPMGCPLTVVKEGDTITVSGNTCKRGEAYGTQELVAPKRVVTSLVRTLDGGVASVKTAGVIDKDKIFAVLDALKGVEIALPVHIGDVILANVLGTGVDVVATCNKL